MLILKYLAQTELPELPGRIAWMELDFLASLRPPLCALIRSHEVFVREVEAI
jgi:hypothetical protein